MSSTVLLLAVAVENCTNGIDDDGDTLVDCADPDCSADPVCQPFVPTCGENHTQGIVSYWKADGDALDSVDGNDGTINGATFTAGQVGQAFSFDGVDDYVEHNTALVNGTPFSISAWVKTSATANEAVFWTGNKDSSYHYFDLIILNGHAAADARDGGTGSQAEGTTYINDGKWHHVVAVFNSSTYREIFVDGNLENTDTNFRAPTGINRWSIGKMRDATPALDFNGSIDEVAIYNRALTADEIKQHYINGLNSEQYCTPAVLEPFVPTCGENHTQGIVSYWKADGDAYDYVNGNDGIDYGGLSYASGRVGQAFSFDGVDDYVSIPEDSSLNYTSSNRISVALWAKTDVTQVQSPIADNGDGADDRATFEIFDNNGVFWARLFDQDDIQSTAATITGGTWNSGQWYYIVILMNGTDFVMYVNGEELASTSFSGRTIRDFDSPIAIGRRGDGSSGYFYHFDGSIDEVAIYNRALTPDEIYQQYINGLNNEQYCTPATMVNCIDSDGDGYYVYDSVNCTAGNDCDDNDNSIYPGASETACNGIDNDCDGEIDEDYIPYTCGGAGICEAFSTCASGVDDTCWDSLDNDCDTLIDQNDPDCEPGGVTPMPACTLIQMLDLNGDSSVNINDAVHILRYITGKEEQLNMAKACEAWSVKTG